MQRSWRRSMFILLIASIGMSCSLFSGPTPTSAPVIPDDGDRTLQFAPANLPDAQSGAPYEVKIEVGNVRTFVAQFDILEGALPAGLAFERVPSENATWIKGTPGETGTFSFKLHVLCFGTNDPGQEGDHLYQIVVK